MCTKYHRPTPDRRHRLEGGPPGDRRLDLHDINLFDMTHKDAGDGNPEQEVEGEVVGRKRNVTDLGIKEPACQQIG